MRTVLLCATGDELDELAALLRRLDCRVVIVSNGSVPVFEDTAPIAMIISDGIAESRSLSQALQGTCPVMLISDLTNMACRFTAMESGVSALVRRPVNPIEISEWLAILSAGDDPRYFSVLIVDDDWLIAEVAAEVLRSAGIAARTVQDPDRALRIIEDEAPDLVLMDMQMPKVNGIELTRIIRQSRQLQKLPIVFLSGERDEALRRAARSLSGAEFIAKPIVPEALIAFVRSRAQGAKFVRTGREPDLLTGVYGPAIFSERLVKEIDDCSRRDAAVSLCVIDIDRISEVRAKHGHAMADHVLQTLASLLVSGLRPVDVVGRCDKQTLGVILPDCDIETATTAVDVVRRRFSQIIFSDNGERFNATFSADIFDPRRDEDRQPAPFGDRAVLHTAERLSDAHSESFRPLLIGNEGTCNRSASCHS